MFRIHKIKRNLTPLRKVVNFVVCRRHKLRVNRKVCNENKDTLQELLHEEFNDVLSDSDSEYDCSSGSDIDHNISHEFEIKNQLIKAGLEAHLASDFCGEKTPAAIGTVLTRVARFIQWEYMNTAASGNSDVGELNIQKILYDLIKHRYTQVSSYRKHLSEIYKMDNSTITNTLHDLSKVCEWFAAYRSDRDVNYPTDASKNVLFIDIYSSFNSTMYLIITS